jgi:tRNA (adenine57-N1/adenine58-N1)-methyltransferase
VEQLYGPGHPAWELVLGDLAETLSQTDVDRVILDMLAPWECIDAASEALTPGGILCAYVATTTQLSKVVETLRAHGGFTEPSAWESLVRQWHVEGLAVRPDHKMVGHTAFLVTARRMAPGEKPPMKRRRPSPGAYGPDYDGPRPSDLPASPE